MMNQEKNKLQWNLIEKGLPTAGVPIIVAIKSETFDLEKKFEIKIAYPVIYQKDFWKDRWCFYDCSKGEVIGPKYSEVIAWVEMPSTLELDEFYLKGAE